MAAADVLKCYEHLVTRRRPPRSSAENRCAQQRRTRRPSPIVRQITRWCFAAGRMPHDLFARVALLLQRPPKANSSRGGGRQWNAADALSRPANGYGRRYIALAAGRLTGNKRKYITGRRPRHRRAWNTGNGASANGRTTIEKSNYVAIKQLSSTSSAAERCRKNVEPKLLSACRWWRASLKSTP